MSSSSPAIAIDRASKVYGTGVSPLTALSEVTLTVACGEFVALMGPSGSGKSTLLNLVAGLDEPTAGSVTILGKRLTGLSDDVRSDLRLRKIGIVFQAYNLLPAFTVAQNVALPLEFLGARTRPALARAAAMLADVGIDTTAHRRLPAELSGGEQQRVALARALIGEPEILLADEPTGNLDSHTGEAVLDLVRQLNAMRRLTIVMATHSAQAASYAQRTVALLDGRVVRNGT
jgi:putative ABC transport system ATP-binding protein